MGFGAPGHRVVASCRRCRVADGPRILARNARASHPAAEAQLPR
jgi:hypothetical protein